MLERLVEYWLTSVGEIGYQTAFSQLLIAEGHQLLQPPIHHGFEHGKDILSFDENGVLCAFQLKGPTELSTLSALADTQGQLDALAMSAISHAALGAPRLPGRIILVTNGVLRPEVRSRLDQIALGYVSRGLPRLEYVERAPLLSRFLDAHGAYLPNDPPNFLRFVHLYGEQGRDPLYLPELSGFLRDLLPVGAGPSATEARRALASASLFCAYSLRGWEKSENHLAVAAGWLGYCSLILHFAEEDGLAPGVWQATFDLAFAAGSQAIKALVAEAAAKPDLAIPHLLDGAFYGTRALQVLGFGASLYLSDRIRGIDDSKYAETLRVLILREARYVRALGESAAPLLFAIASAISILSTSGEAEALIGGWASSLLRRNQPDSGEALPDPYHSLEGVLAKSVGAEARDVDARERYEGNAYTAHIAFEWLARRLRRQLVAAMWRDYTGLSACEFKHSKPSMMFAMADDAGKLEMWLPDRPGSWSKLRAAALAHREDAIPLVLESRRGFLPFVGPLMPPRLTADLSRTLDFYLFPSGDYTVTPRVAQPAPRARRPATRARPRRRK